MSENHFMHSINAYEFLDSPEWESTASQIASSTTTTNNNKNSLSNFYYNTSFRGDDGVDGCYCSNSQSISSTFNSNNNNNYNKSSSNFSNSSSLLTQLQTSSNPASITKQQTTTIQIKQQQNEYEDTKWKLKHQRIKSNSRRPLVQKPPKQTRFNISLIASKPSMYLFWERSTLEYYLSKDRYMSAVLSLLLARDITNKLYQINHQVIIF